MSMLRRIIKCDYVLCSMYECVSGFSSVLLLVILVLGDLGSQSLIFPVAKAHPDDWQ